MMLATWARVFVRSSKHVLKPVSPLYKTIDAGLVDQLVPGGRRLLATAAAAKKTTTTKKPAAATKKATTKTVATKKTATTTKAAAAKKKTTPVKKAAAKTTATKKKKAAPVAEKPKKKLKKDLTDEEKLKIKVKALRERALEPPALRPARSQWLAFCQAKFAGTKGSGNSIAKNVNDYMPQWQDEYKNLSDAQRMVCFPNPSKKIDHIVRDRNVSLTYPPHRNSKKNARNLRTKRRKASWTGSTPTPQFRSTMQTSPALSSAK